MRFNNLRASNSELLRLYSDLEHKNSILILDNNELLKYKESINKCPIVGDNCCLAVAGLIILNIVQFIN